MKYMSDYSHLTGLELVQGMLTEGSPAGDVMLGTMNFHAVEFEKGRAIFEGTPEKKHLNMAGRVHGGWALTVLDSAMGSSVMSTLPPGKASTTATMETKFMRAVAAGRVYRCTGEVMKSGRTLCHARSELVDVETGHIVGTATGTFAVIPH